jgi:hypothetical protein
LSPSLLQVIDQALALPAENRQQALAIAQQWAMENGYARDWDDWYRQPETKTPTIALTPIQQMLAGVEEISKQFGFELVAIEGFEAPRVNVLRFKPAPTTDVTKIWTKFDNVIARVPGIPAMPAPVIRITDDGIEILTARKKWSFCHLTDYINPTPWNPREPLQVTWGVTVEGQPYRIPLVHAQVVGETGGGKTALLNAFLGELTIVYKPWQVQWLLIDVEQVGLCQFNHLPYFWRGNDRSLPDMSICDPADGYRALQSVLVEHERRLAILKGQGVDSIERFNRKSPDSALPHLVVLVDECAVFRSNVGRALLDNDEENSAKVMTEGKALTDNLLIEISQRCRKTGIHLVIATQRAAQDSIDPNLRDNLGTKIVLRCNSEGGSAVAFGYKCDWAVRLAGNGDMWVVGSNGVERCQGLYLDCDEPLSNGCTRLENLLNAVRSHQPYIDWLAKQIPQAPQKWTKSSTVVEQSQSEALDVSKLCNAYRKLIAQGVAETPALIEVFGHLHSTPANAAAGNSRTKYLRWIEENA